MVLYKQLLSIIVLLCCSCGPSGVGPQLENGRTMDSIQVHYLRSKDGDRSLEERTNSVNRSWALLEGNLRDSIFGYVLYQKCRLHLSSREYDSLLYYNDLFQNLGPQFDDDYNKARQHYLMGYYFSGIAKDYEKGFMNFSKSRDFYGILKDSIWIGRNLLNMGTIQKNQNDFFGSKETLTEALQYLKSPEDDAIIAQCYNLLATDHRKLANYGDAVLYFDRAIKKAGTPGEKRTFENNLATSHIDEGQYVKAIAILEEIRRDSSLDKASSNYARILDNLSYAKWLNGDKKDPATFSEALKIRKDKGDLRGQLASYTHLGEFYAAVDPRRSKLYFDSVITISREVGIPLAEKDVIEFMMDLDPDDIGLRDRYIFLSDSLYREELKVKTQFAKYKYDDMQHRESILKLEKEQAENALKASQTKIRTLISISVMALLVLGTGFVGFYFRQRAKRLLEENRMAGLEATRQTEAELSRKLHDNFGAGLNQAMLMVQGKSDSEKVLDVLDNLYKQSRNISRELNAVDTGANFKDVLMEMLRMKTQPPTNLLLKGNKDVDWDAMDPNSKEVLYKVLQELMINMGKHSKASLVTIGFKKEDGKLKVEYADNGVGATARDLLAKNGLRNTEKRIGAIKGTIIFDSGKDGGFRANMVIPY